jgi:rhodanese-related sulfurtransferase
MRGRVPAIKIVNIKHLINTSMNTFKSLSAREVHSLLQKTTGPLIIDVRTRSEYESTTGHLSGSVLLPLHELETRRSELLQHKGRTIVVYCHAGHRSKRASRILSNDGFSVIDIDGGIDEWIMSGLPVVYSK